MTDGAFDPSPELLIAIRDERSRLESLVPALESDRDRLRDELAAVEGQLAAITDRHRQLGHLVGDDDGGQPPLWRPQVAPEALDDTPGSRDAVLRGAAIRQAAVRAALAPDDDPARPRHYRDWLELVEAGGWRIDGRDPAATLLTQLSRCPLVVRAPEPGTYRLDPEAPTRLRAKRHRLHAEASAKVAAAAERDDDAIDLAQALARIESEVRRTDRAIDEAAAIISALDAGWFFQAGERDDDAARRPSADDEAATRVALR